MIFLQSASIDPSLAAAFLALGVATVFFVILLILGVYIYSSFAYMALARKAKYLSPGIAWIPIVGPALIVSKTAKMHWWPVLLLIGLWIPILGGLLSIAFLAF